MSSLVKTFRSGIARSLFLIIICLGVAAAAITARSWRSPGTAATSTKALLPKMAQPAQGRERHRSNVESELIVVKPYGFEPNEITPSHRHFLLVLQNRSGDDRITVRLGQQGTDKIRDIRLSLNTPDWSDELDLESGHYTLTEAGHSSWVCRINIGND